MKSVLIVCALFAVIAAKPTDFFVSVPTIYTSHISQFHSQDGLGQYAYGYNGDLSTKSETRTIDGITRGTYSYIDADGNVQTVEYTADPILGFRAAATNLPKAPIDTAIAPEPVKDTEEVIKARANHLAAFDEVVKRIDSMPTEEQKQQMPEQVELKLLPTVTELKPMVNEEMKSIPIENTKPILPERIATFRTEEIPTTISHIIAPSTGFTYSTPWVDAHQFGYVIRGVPFIGSSVPFELHTKAIEQNNI